MARLNSPTVVLPSIATQHGSKAQQLLFFDYVAGQPWFLAFATFSEPRHLCVSCKGRNADRVSPATVPAILDSRQSARMKYRPP